MALEFCQTIETGYRDDAAKHLDGEGLQRGGAGACAVTNEMNRFTRKGQFDQWALDLRAVAGAQLP
eukprot:2491341-Pyramimonas_sp.AAC.1